MEASAPLASHIEPEPKGWQPRALWVTARLLCGAASFFFLAFLFAYFYLRSLDVNKAWKIGSGHPSVAFGVIIAVVLVASAVLMRLAVARPTAGLPLAAGALGLGLLSVLLQVIDWTTLGVGPARGASAAVFFGWPVCYAVFPLPWVYWIEPQRASLWRARREGLERPRR